MKKILMMSIYAMLFLTANSVFAQVYDGVYVRENTTTPVLDGQAEGFFLNTSTSTIIIDAASPYDQCKKIADFATRGKKFNQEMFDSALVQMNAILANDKSIKEWKSLYKDALTGFKTWGESLKGADTAFKRMPTDSFINFFAQCDIYGLGKGIFTVDGVSIWFINGLKILSVENQNEDKLSFKEVDINLSKVKNVSIEKGYSIKVIPDSYTMASRCNTK